ncbi:hypothetical protein OE88DRAFT_1654206 [Heliocybe sulcata]|uniref:Zn(2)-C6 fungal-type domain-containing protein n=1 Tax=Heliocybe sulcata TaxID=5364 RepID=A0A5C3N9E7_9AGAM|nr:hypothetical protein OE88DRAFT_1654206 [Heliocybe sulcata]
MEDFRFVHESPQSQQVHRKRPRLVTACDNCRVKKIRCVKPASNEKCEACAAGNAVCEFRDRERYFQERSRLIAGSTAGVAAMGSRRRTPPYARHSRVDDSPYSRYSDPNPRTPGTPSSTPPTEYLSLKHDRHLSEPTDYYSEEQYLPRTVSLSYPSPSSNSLWTYPSSSSSASPSYSPILPIHPSPHIASVDPVQLFDASNPAYPSFTLMPHFLSLFFDNFGAQCPYLDQDDLLGRFYDQTLPATIANSIASLAVRYTDVQQLQSMGLRSIADQYSVNAKVRPLLYRRLGTGSERATEQPRVDSAHRVPGYPARSHAPLLIRVPPKSNSRIRALRRRKHLTPPTHTLD